MSIPDLLTGDAGGATGQQFQSATFVPLAATVARSSITHPERHLLSLPKEIRDKALEHVEISADEADDEPLTSHGVTGKETLSTVCRLLFHDTANDRNQTIVKVPRNRLQLFIDQLLGDKSAYKHITSLTLDLPHNSPKQFFRDIAVILALLREKLEQLKIFGVGPDGYGNQTSSQGHPCGKVDTSIFPQRSSLPLDGQEYNGRVILLNSLQYLGKLKVLVLDNLNMPLTQAQMLKNKPHLQRLRIGTDPRSILHSSYMRPGQDLGLGNMIYPISHAPAPVKELDISSNAVPISGKLLRQMMPTLEILNWTIPDFRTQNGNNFLQMAMNGLIELSQAKKLRVLRLCIHGAMYDHVNDMASFMWWLRTNLQNVPTLKVVELHIHSRAPWFAQEFIRELPSSVERLFIADHFVHKDLRQLTELIGELTHTCAVDYSNGWWYLGSQGLDRKDFIPFTDKRLGFVSYEYDQKEEEEFDLDIITFMKVNGRMLDKERNKHLARYKGRHIPYMDKGLVKPVVTDPNPHFDDTDQYTDQEEPEQCGLDDNDPYFGNEDAAEAVFRTERVARLFERSHYSLPTVCDVEDPFCAAGHWLST